MKENISKNKVWQIIGVSVLCAVCVLGAVFGIVFGMNLSNVDSNNVADIPTDPIVMEMTESKNISLMSGVATTADDGTVTKNLTASVSPKTAEYLKYSWKVEFVNANSTWAKGKIVTDYVSVTKDNTNDLKATLTYKKAFNEQIKVTVFCVLKSECSASATVDCYKKVIGLTVTFDGDTTVVCNGIGAQHLNNSAVSGYFVASNYRVSYDVTYGDGTICKEITGGMQTDTNDLDFVNALDLTSADFSQNTGYAVAILYGNESLAVYTVLFYLFPTSMTIDNSNIKF